MKLVKAIFSTFVVFLLLPLNVLLAEGISLSPTRSILNTIPGQSLEVNYSILNSSKSTKSFRLQAAQLVGEDIVTDPDLTKVGWIKLKSDSFELTPDKQTDISFNIDVAADAIEGVYRFVIIAQEVTPPNLRSTGTGVSMAIGYAVEVNVVTTLPAGKLDTFLHVTPSFNIDNRFEVSVTLENNGNVNTYPMGYLKVFSPKGEVVFQEVINDRQLEISPNSKLVSEYEFSVNLDNPLDAFGVFKAELIALEPSLGLTSNTSHTFVHIPLVIFIFGALGVLLVLSLLIKAVSGRRKRVSKIS